MGTAVCPPLVEHGMMTACMGRVRTRGIYVCRYARGSKQVIVRRASVHRLGPVVLQALVVGKVATYLPRYLGKADGFFLSPSLRRVGIQWSSLLGLKRDRMDRSWLGLLWRELNVPRGVFPLSCCPDG